MTLRPRITTRAVMMCALYGALSVLVCASLFIRPNGVGHYDWDQHLFYYASVLKSVVEYGQWPFWNPWYCGGNVLWQNPQVALLSPAYPLALVVSLPLAMKLNIVLHYWIGFIGMHMLLRRTVGVTFLPLVIYLACVFVACGALALHVAEGHSWVLPAFYLPLQLFWVCRAVSEGRVRDALAAGILLALMTLNGGLHIVPMAVIGIGIVALVSSVMRRSWQPVLIAMMCGMAGFMYAAPKIVPILTFLKSDRFQDDRAMGLTDSLSLGMVTHAYLDPLQTREMKLPDQLYGWHEYGNYVGVPAAALIGAAIAWILLGGGAPTRRWLSVSCAVAALALFTISLGEFGPWAPASLARAVPFLSSYRIPSRYTIAFVLFATISVGCWLADASVRVTSTRTGRILLSLLCVLASGDLIWRNGARFEDIFNQEPLKQEFRLLRPTHTLVTDTTIDAYRQDAPMLRALMANRSTFNCYEPLKLKRLAEPARPLVFTDESGPTVSSMFSPNRIDVTLGGVQRASRLFVNENFAPGWRSTLGAVSADPRYGNIAVAVPAGVTGDYSISFSPPGLARGCVIFVAAIAASMTLWTLRIDPQLPRTGRAPRVRAVS